MRGVFDDRGFEPAPPSHDTELTLGNGTLLAIFFGLLIVCGLCFGLGYVMGRHGAVPAVANLQPVPSAPASLQANASRTKPSATAQQGVAQTNPAVQSESTASLSVPVINFEATGAPAMDTTRLPEARPALDSTASAPKPAPPQTVRPALAPQGPLMVQIAAVANPEDGEVLLNALRKRGYAVTVRREPDDNLLHVRIGPFNSRDEANRWRQKLLNDGYNAIIMP